MCLLKEIFYPFLPITHQLLVQHRYFSSFYGYQWHLWSRTLTALCLCFIAMVIQDLRLACQWSLEYTDWLSHAEGVRPTNIHACLECDTDRHLVVRLYFWSSEEWIVPLYCHNSLVHSDQE